MESFPPLPFYVSEYDDDTSSAGPPITLEFNYKPRMMVSQVQYISYDPMTTSGSGTSNLECKTLALFVINTLFGGCLCLMGLVGNSASFVVLGRERDIFPVARFLLRSLAVSDSGLIVCWFYLYTLESLFVYTELIPFSHVMSGPGFLYLQLIFSPLIFICQCVTIWLAVFIAATRFAIVCSPDKMAAYCTLTNIRRGVAVIVLLAFIYNFPRFFYGNIELINTNGTATQAGNATQKSFYIMSVSKFAKQPLFQLIYLDVLYYIVSCFLPLLFLLFFNTRLIISYRKFHQNRIALQSDSSNTTNSTCTTTTEPHEEKTRVTLAPPEQKSSGGNKEDGNNVTLIMILIILIFIICNLPAKIVQIVWEYRWTSECHSFEFFMIRISDVLEVAGSTVNFIIYCTFLKRFFHHLCNRPCGWLESNSS